MEIARQRAQKMDECRVCDLPLQFCRCHWNKKQSQTWTRRTHSFAMGSSLTMHSPVATRSWVVESSSIREEASHYTSLDRNRIIWNEVLMLVNNHTACLHTNKCTSEDKLTVQTVGWVKAHPSYGLYVVCHVPHRLHSTNAYACLPRYSANQESAIQ